MRTLLRDAERELTFAPHADEAASVEPRVDKAIDEMKAIWKIVDGQRGSAAVRKVDEF